MSEQTTIPEEKIIAPASDVTENQAQTSQPVQNVKEETAAAGVQPEETASPAVVQLEETAAVGVQPEEIEVLEVQQEESEAPDLSGKTLPELSELFVELKDSASSMLRSKEAEAIKSSFYKLLIKIKSEAGEVIDNSLETVEENFKALYADYKKARSEFNRQQEAQREENLEKKKAVIEELRAMVDADDEISNINFQSFRELQNRWRDAGPVPATAFRNINDTYQFLVERFYDKVKINRDLRDLDFKKNLEAKTAFCEAAEKLAENENVVNAFHELQKLHEQWKEFGPVAKEFREDIWDRFKAATAVVNKKYQEHFEALKESYAANLQAKTGLCEELEAIVAKEINSSNEWNAMTEKVEEIQKKWRTIGFATKKDNQKIYDRFRASCDAFFAKKREFYSQFKDSMNENLAKKMSIIEQAEALKTSTEWKKATDQFIALQKQWKEIGAVPRKKSEQLWTRFRAACDEFFAERDKNAKPENDFYSNLKAKKRLIEDILAYEAPAAEAELAEAMRGFESRWQEIGFVPFKEKDSVTKSYKEAMQSKFPMFGQRGFDRRQPRHARSEREILIDKYHSLQQDITTYENNIGFFADSKNSGPLVKQMMERIEKAKQELSELEARIRKAEEENK